MSHKDPELGQTPISNNYDLPAKGLVIVQSVC